MENRNMRRLVEEIFGLSQRVRSLELVPQLGNSSLEGTALEVYDSEGNFTGLIGTQSDGSLGVNVMDGPTPAAPVEVTFEGGPQFIEVTWKGGFAGNRPLDFAFIAIHASIDPNFVPTAANTVGSISVIEETSRIIPISAAGYFIKATTVSLANKRSEPTEESFVEVSELVDEESIKLALETERTAREQAYEEASTLLAELDTRLGEIDGLDGMIEQLRQQIESDLAAAKVELEQANEAMASDLSTLRGELSTAQDDLSELVSVTIPEAVTALEEVDAQVRVDLTGLDSQLSTLDTKVASHGTNLGTLNTNYTSLAQAAQTAQSTADAAHAQALLAAGIADSKGKIIYSEEEPPAEDRSTSNLWVVPSTGESRAWNEDDQEWVLVQNEALDAALKAAQKAQQDASKAITDAAGALTAAQAAQTTANQATLDAGSAHNEAVAAQTEAARIATEVANKSKVHYGTTPPTSDQRANTLWFDTANSNTPKVWSGSAWVSLNDPRVATAQTAAQAAQSRADAAYAEAETRMTEAQSKAIAETARAAAEANSRAEIEAAESRAATEALRVARVEAEKEASEAEAAAKAYADLQSSGASGDALNAAKAYAEQQAEQARIAAEAAASADATAKMEDAEAEAAVEAARVAKAEADAAYAKAQADLTAVTKTGGVIDQRVKTSANGKNAITHSTSAPGSTKGVVEGDIWYRIDADGKAYAEWRWSGSAWVAVLLRNEMIDTLDVNKLQVGNADITSAVIDKIWAQQMAVKKIYAENIAANTITSGEIAADAITASELAANSVTAGSVSANAITAAKIQAGAITVDKIATNAVTAVKVAANAITAEKITSGAITADKIAANAITAEKLNVTEEMTTKIANVMKLNVVNLVAGTGKIDEAVINKVWADGIAAKSVTASRLTISPGNLIAGEETWANGPVSPSSEDPWRSFGMNTTDPSIWVRGDDTGSRFIYVPIRLKAGSRYRFSVDVKGTKANTAFYARLHKGTEEVPNASEYYTNVNPKSPASASYIVVSGRSGAANRYATTVSEFTIEEDGWAWLRVLPNHSSGTNNDGGYQWFKNIRLQEMVGATIIEDGAISTDKLTADAVTADKIKALAVETGHMQANSIDGDRIRVNTLSGDRIEANTISAEKISGGSFVGKSFSGGTFRGTQIEATNYKGEGAILLPDTTAGAGGLFFSDNGSVSGSQAAIYRGRSSTSSLTSDLSIRPASGGSVYLGGGTIVSGTLTISGGILNAPHVDTRGFQLRGDMNTAGGTTINNYGSLRQHGSRVYMHNLTSTSSTGNLVISNSSKRIYHGVSSRRYKRNIVDWNPEAKRVLALQPRQWQHDDPASDEIDETWYVGFIAEEVDDLGLDRLVQYVGDGKGGWIPEALNYDRFAAAQQIVLQKHEAEITELKAENAELKDRLAAIEEKIATL